LLASVSANTANAVYSYASLDVPYVVCQKMAKPIMMLLGQTHVGIWELCIGYYVPDVGDIKRYRDPSVCLSHGAAALGYRHAGCLQLSVVRTADPSADRRRSAASRTAIARRGHIVSPPPGRIIIIIIIIIHEYYYGGAVALLLQDHLTMSKNTP